MVCIIKNADDPNDCEFLTDDRLNNLVFNSFEEADQYLMENAEAGVTYRMYDGE